LCDVPKTTWLECCHERPFGIISESLSDLDAPLAQPVAGRRSQFDRELMALRARRKEKPESARQYLGQDRPVEYGIRIARYKHHGRITFH
jgi:hypothetical protein